MRELGTCVYVEKGSFCRCIMGNSDVLFYVSLSSFPRFLVSSCVSGRVSSCLVSSAPPSPTILAKYPPLGEAGEITH